MQVFCSISGAFVKACHSIVYLCVCVCVSTFYYTSTLCIYTHIVTVYVYKFSLTYSLHTYVYIFTLQIHIYFLRFDIELFIFHTACDIVFLFCFILIYSIVFFLTFAALSTFCCDPANFPLGLIKFYLIFSYYIF